MSDGIHRAAAEGFGAAAQAYERGRPGYPAEAVAFIIETLGVGSRQTVLELGAGTGKLTRLLEPTGARMVAVEPIAAMLVELVTRSTSAHALAGTAEAIPLIDAAVDAVVVAQAFHWFDGERALAEIHRVLRPRGRLALAFNRRDENDALMARLGEIFEPYRRGTPSHRHDGWRRAFDRTELFAPLQQRAFAHAQMQTPDEVVARVLSISFVAALPLVERDVVAREVRELLSTHPHAAGREEIRMPYRTDVFWCERV